MVFSLFFCTFATELLKQLKMKKSLSLIFCVLVFMQSCGSHHTMWNDNMVVHGNKTVTAKLMPLLSDTIFNRSTVGISVYDLDEDRMLFEYNSHLLLRPGSTMKLITAITALDVLGPDYNYTTTLGYTGQIKDRTLHGDIVCTGGMDPTITTDDVKEFTSIMKSTGIDAVNGSLIGDVSMKDTLIWGEGWCWDDDNPPLSPLLCDGKDDLLSILRDNAQKNNLSITGSSIYSNSPVSSTLIATKHTPIAFVMQRMMKESDNLYAESMFYNIAKGTATSITAENVKDILNQTLLKAGVNPFHCRLADGSGLSLYDYLSSDLELKMLIYAYRNLDIYHTLYPTLPIAGVDGTLKGRMHNTPAFNNVHAKTGTVRGVSSLAGYLTTAHGHHLAFSIINQGIKTSAEGRAFQDRFCAEMAKLKSY